MTIKVAAIGLGLLGEIECQSYNEIDGVDIIAGADVAAEARKTFTNTFKAPAYETIEEVLDGHENELDAVNIVTPHTLHFQQTKRCLESGYHVFLEKPITTDITDAVKLVEIAQQNDVILQLGYQRHFEPTFIEIKRIIESGRLGRIHMASCFLGQEWISIHDGSWRVDPSLSGGGQLYDSGSHLIDTLLWTLDAEPMTVTAVFDNMGNDVDVNSALATTLNRDGNTITASIAVTGDGPDTSSQEGIIIWGTDGFVSLLNGKLSVQESNGIMYESTIEFTDFREITRTKIEKFVSAIRTNSSSAVPGSYGVSVTALTEAAYQSAESDSTINVQSLLKEAEETAAEQLTH